MHTKKISAHKTKAKIQCKMMGTASEHLIRNRQSKMLPIQYLLHKLKFKLNMRIQCKHTSLPGMYGLWEETRAPRVKTHADMENTPETPCCPQNEGKSTSKSIDLHKGVGHTHPFKKKKNTKTWQTEDKSNNRSVHPLKVWLPVVVKVA